MIYTISGLAALLRLPFQGDGTRQLARVSRWESADSYSLVFLESREKQVQLPDFVHCACIMAPRDLVLPGINAIFSERPKLDFARAGALLNPLPGGKGLRHPSAVVAATARIEDEVDLGPYVTIGEGARIGRGCVLHAGVVVGDGCVVGQQCTLFPRVVLYPGAELRNRVVLHSGTIIGSDGFGYVCDGRAQIKFPQVGTVLIEDDVEIGSNTTVDRGSLGTTRIGVGTKIDNLVQIAHNVQIGQGVVIAAQTGISGSTIIEDYAIIGGQVGFGDHARVQQGAIIGSKAGVLPGKIVRGGDVYWGVPVRPLREYKRLNALFGRLPEMKEDINTLKDQIAQLHAALRKLEPH
jgi:UDP-3-O-[3-hydroxymyristoyl] glucosamine N-acyltransferase